ncbi:GntR family transcriptional regulator [Uliginosibacterium aquaticum]|uniref:GntR family transcriptional regulator n=1 Tax=Uliginosibacterium aquaticum TaxID=2731212 RepID=A0ABX2IBT9_9RHOO|nr:GntR family transcriptional regulator [Uliginosibacterium aquaticum]NSL53926.1 GntR family transcriptional regulator [Uliginosibacterium aquaticum]
MNTPQQRVPAPAHLSDADIYEQLIGAVLDHRLAPGTRLTEEKLGRAFGVSRTRIRQVLVRLAAEQVVVQTHNCGATVASPTPADAREVFEARMLIEPSLIAGFIRQAHTHELECLIALLAEEEAANHRGDRRAAIRLSGEFHMKIAQGAGNATLEKILHELISRTSLILMTFGQRSPGRRSKAPLRVHEHSCGCDEHQALVEAIRARDVREAASLMKRHLKHLLEHISFEREPVPGPDIEFMFRQG